MLTAGRVAAVLQGFVWLVMLSHGWWGGVVGPMAWAAAALARRHPAVAAGLLLVPMAALAASWAPIFAQAPQFLAVWLLLVAPAIVSTVCIVLSWKRSTGS